MTDFEQTALEPLAMHLYRQEQMTVAGKRFFGFGILVGFMFVAPWVLHKFGMLGTRSAPSK